MKHKFRLDVKLVRLLAISMMAIALLLVVGSYSVHRRDLDSLYKNDVSKIAKTAAAMLDADALRELARVVSSEEFIRFRETLQEDEEEPVAQWLRERNLYDAYQSMADTLRRIEINMDVAYIYVQDIQDGFSYYLIPSKGISYFGYAEENPSEFSTYTGNMHIDPTISWTGDGWLSSGCEPVFDSDGNAVATACVDLDMTRVMMERFRFLGAMIVLSILFILLCGFISVRQIRRMVIKPLGELATGTKRYGEAKDETQLRERVIPDSIHSGDEIEDLCQEIRGMQLRIIDYMDTLTRETAEKERIGAELNVATQIQADMLPRIFPAFPERKEFDIYATMRPAKEVGGDFYDFFLIDDDHLALVTADVSGKGVPAALFMVIAKTLIKNRLQLGCYDPAKVLMEVNNQLCEGNEAELFVTVWLGILTISSGELISGNAGHEYPALCRHGEGFTLLKGRHGPPLAAMEGVRYRNQTNKLEPGDTFYIYTDGVTEATDATPELFGEKRMLEALNSHAEEAPDELIPGVLASINAFVADAPQFDDITMLAIRYQGNSDSTAPDTGAQ